MTKHDIASALIHRDPDLTRAQALDLVEAITDIFIEAFVGGQNIYLRGFGAFKVNTTKEKIARNISTNSPILVPPCRVVRFHAYPGLKKRLNNGTVD